MTDVEVARLSLNKTVESFDAIVAEAEGKAKPAPPARPDFGGDIQTSLLGKIMNSITTFSWRDTISRNEAWNGLVAARKIIVRLASATDDYREIDAFNQLLTIVRDELTQMVNDDWQSRNDAYKPYTGALVTAAKRLKAARDRAAELANSLDIAADVIGAFSKLLGAF